MINYFTVVNLGYVTNHDFINSIKTDFVIVSITSPGLNGYRIPYSPFCKDTLHLQFHDCAPDPANREMVLYGSLVKVVTLKPIDENIAKQIIDFAKKYQNVKDWLVHCEAGLSRSPAVALALSEILNATTEPEQFVQGIYGTTHHNKYVRNVIMDVYNNPEKSI